MKKMAQIISNWTSNISYAMIGVASFMDDASVQNHVLWVDSTMRAFANNKVELTPMYDRTRQGKEVDNFL